MRLRASLAEIATEKATAMAAESLQFIDASNAANATRERQGTSIEARRQRPACSERQALPAQDCRRSHAQLRGVIERQAEKPADEVDLGAGDEGQNDKRDEARTIR